MNFNAYLNFNGNCREAMNVYAELLGAKITAMLTFEEGGAGEHVSPDLKQGIMHASLELNGQVLMASDAPAEMYAKPQGTSICLHPESVAEAERLFAILAEGGQVMMPLAATSWTAGFGMLTDRFGTPWMFNVAEQAEA